MMDARACVRAAAIVAAGCIVWGKATLNMWRELTQPYHLRSVTIGVTVQGAQVQLGIDRFFALGHFVETAGRVQCN